MTVTRVLYRAMILGRQMTVGETVGHNVRQMYEGAVNLDIALAHLHVRCPK
jgi:hypothetical protein